MVQTLEHSIYIHGNFCLIYCFDVLINSLTRPALALSFVAKQQSRTLWVFVLHSVFILTPNLQHDRTMPHYYFEHGEERNF